MQTFIISETEAGQRLDIWLASRLSITRTQAQKLVQGQLVLVQNTAIKPSHILEAGENVLVENPKPPQPSERQDIDLPVVYEEDDIIVIDKPPHLSVHPAHEAAYGPTVTDFTASRVDDDDELRPGIVHRLDKDTSGLLIIAKHPEAKKYFKQLFRDRQINKTYTVLVVGRLADQEARIDLAIDRSKTNPLKRIVSSSGRPSQTTYKVTANLPGYTLAEAYPKTGRTHQIRVHFAALGHPVAGDIVYGVKKRPAGLTRQFLHASSLEFTDRNGKHHIFTSSLPSDLANFLKDLGYQL